MAYLLILLVCLYTVLATVVLQRQPRGISNTILAIYLFSVAGATAGYLMIGTTSERTIAELAIVLVAFVTSWAFLAFLPLTLLSLYFESWLRLRLRRMVLRITAIVVVVDAVVLWWINRDLLPLVRANDPGFDVHWSFESSETWLLIILVVTMSQFAVFVVLGTALRYRRITRHDAVPFVLASLCTVLFLLISPLFSPHWSKIIGALSYAPTVLLLTSLIYKGRQIPLEAVIRSIGSNYNEGMIVIDRMRKVIWQNSQVTRWLGVGQPGAVAPTHIFEMLRESPLLDTVQHMLESGIATGECDIVQNGEQVVIRVDIQPIDGVRALPGAQLIGLRDITASRVRRDLDRRSQELHVLSTIGADISSSLETEQVITRALQQVRAITRADSAAIYLLVDANPQSLTLAGDLSAVQADPGTPASLPVKDTAAGKVIETGHTLIVPDASRDTTYGAAVQALGLGSGLTVPLMIRERAVGVFQLGYQQRHTFDATEVALLESVGRQLAVAIENARLHSKERHQRQVAEALREVASVLNTKKLDDALQVMLTHLARILSYSRASVLLRAEPGMLSIRAQVGFRFEPDDPPLETKRIEIARFPYLVKMFDERAPQMVSDTTTQSDWMINKHPYGSWMGLPLIIRDQVLGCLSVVHDQAGHFTAEDLDVASAFAHQTVVAVENTHLFETEQRRRITAELIQRASLDLVSSPDLDSALSVALINLSKLLRFDRAHIGLLNQDGSTWTPRVVYPFPQTNLADVRIAIEKFPLIQHAIVEKRLFLISDTRQAPEWRTAAFAPQEIRCWIGMPLIVRDRVIGILNVDSFTPHSFSLEEVQLVQLFANQIAAATENFNLLEEASRQNRTLSALNTVLSASNEALTQENLLSVTLERTLDILSLSGGAIHQTHATEGELRLRATSGLPMGAVHLLDRIPAADCLPDVTLSDGTNFSFFSVPLISHGSEIGLLSVCCEPGPLTSELKKLLVNIGQQLGVVVENAILFEDTVRRESLSTDLGRLGLAISAQLDRDTTLNLICRESIGIFDAQGAYIWLIEGDTLLGAAAHGPGADRFAGHSYSLKDTDQLPVKVLKDWLPSAVNHVASQHVLSVDFLRLTRARSALAIPLLKADIPIGTLLLINTEKPDAFPAWLVEQVGLLGVQAALAIQNATLFDEIRRRLDQLRLVNEVSRYATAILGLQSLVEGVAHKLFETLHYDTIGLLQLEDGQLVVHSILSQHKQFEHADASAYYLSAGSAVVHAIQQAEPILQNRQCSSQGTNNGHASQPECCSLAIPLILADEVIGALVVERRGSNSITPADLDVLEPLAAQLSISVSTARLFETVRQQTVELEARVAARTAEIRQQHERIEAILRSVADAVIVFDLNGQIVMTNPVAKNLFDRHDLEMDLGQRVGALIKRTLSTDNDEDNSTTEIIELGQVALQAKAAHVVEGDQVSGAVVVLRDISRLQELDRMKDNFVSNVSHELRTPLANLKLYLSLLQQGRPERRASYFEVMEREVARLARLISDLLDLSRLQSEQRSERAQVREPVDVANMIKTMIQTHSAWASTENKTLHYENLTTPLPWIMGDPDQVVRALTNLVSNAINYTPEGGRIVVRSHAEQSEHSSSEWVIIEVEDTGIGIPAAELPVIFERFYRGSNVNPSVPGTGLGLAIIKDIVELHGGHVEVESEEGRGSTFRLRFPALNTQVVAPYGGT